MIIRQDRPDYFENDVPYDDVRLNWRTYREFVRQQELQQHNEMQTAGDAKPAPVALIEPVDLLLAGTMMLVSLILLLYAG